MQIEDGSIVRFLSSVLGVVATTLTGLYWYIWRGDRARLKTLEDKMQHAVTISQVETIVNRVEEDFKGDHITILKAISDGHTDTRMYIRDMFEAREGHWNGRDRRKK